MAERGSVEVNVVTENGHKVAHARIKVTGTSDTAAYTDPSGKTTIQRLKKGDYEIHATIDNIETETSTFSIDYQGDIETVTLTLNEPIDPSNLARNTDPSDVTEY